MSYVHRTGPARTIHVIMVATLVMLGSVRCTRDSPTTPSRTTTVITLRSDPGDYIGQGQTYSEDALTAIELRFGQHCEGEAPALRDAIRWEQ
jgi:hypothetical protein